MMYLVVAKPEGRPHWVDHKVWLMILSVTGQGVSQDVSTWI